MTAEAPTAVAPPKEKKEKQATTYTILRKQPKGSPSPNSPSASIAGASGPDLYEVVGMQLSDNSVQAIRAFVKAQDAEDGVYVAVPSRSWTEKTVAFEATPQLKIT